MSASTSTATSVPALTPPSLPSPPPPPLPLPLPLPPPPPPPPPPQSSSPSRSSPLCRIHVGLDGVGWQCDVPETLHAPLLLASKHFSARLARHDPSLATVTDDPSLATLGNHPSGATLTGLALAGAFLAFVTKHDAPSNPELSATRAACVTHILECLERDFLQGSDIHTAANTLPGVPAQREEVVRAYVHALATGGRNKPYIGHSAALFEPRGVSATSTFAIFGGQGNPTDVFSELRALYNVYLQHVAPLVQLATWKLQELLAASSEGIVAQLSQGVDVMGWLQHPETMPRAHYTLQAPIALPLAGLVQMANYAVVCHYLDRSPGEMGDVLQGMAGHSQGVVVAATLATLVGWDDFYDALIHATTLLFHVGSAALEQTPPPGIAMVPSNYHGELDQASPTPMLRVRGSTPQQLNSHIATVNERLQMHQQLSIGLIDGNSELVVTGPCLSLRALANHLRTTSVIPGTNQSTTVPSRRKPEIFLQYLPVSTPLHSPHLAKAALIATSRASGLLIKPSDLRLPVFDSRTGDDMRNSDVDDLVPLLVQLALCQQSNLLRMTTFKDATHVVDFGPGGLSGVGHLVHRIKDGTGVRVILAGLAEDASPEFGYRRELFAPQASFNHRWSDLYTSDLVKTQDGTAKIDNRLTRLLGTPPVIVAGMTPTTSSWEFVSAIMNGGYHAELAAGGLHSATKFTQSVRNLARSIPPGRGICINVIYANPRQIKWQIPLIKSLRFEGIAIDGITFGAGVPSAETVQEYVGIGTKYLAFKPGTSSAIEEVVAIARSNASVPILLQLTGGRGGGHHSYEDLHDLIRHSYGRIRRCSNIVLVAGSGFGGADDTYPYLTGMWSCRFDTPAMPFDGVLLGSRMMVAKEAKTSRAAKEAIVAAAGVSEELLWEQSFTQPCGGIITVNSEIGEPIHKVATRGVMFWKELDDTVFNISDKTKRLQKLRQMKPYIIKRLNADYQKVWFGRNTRNEAVDVEEMTYAEVLQRLVQLLYVTRERRWLDPSYMKLTLDFVRRMCSRVPDSPSRLGPDFRLQNPLEALPHILLYCHGIADQTLTYRDAQYFVLLCKRPNQKPPTFLPDLDDDFATWFKKDSLWQSEDAAAVIDKDAGRICILQGPVAARYSTEIDEPVQNILDHINHKHMAAILHDRYGDDTNLVPTIPAPTWTPSPLPSSVMVYDEGENTHFVIPKNLPQDQLPESDQWFLAVAGSRNTWLSDTLVSEDIIQGHSAVANPIRRMLLPSRGMHLTLTRSDNLGTRELTIRESESGRAHREVHQRHWILACKEDIISLTFNMHWHRGCAELAVVFKFVHHPEMQLHPIHEVMEGRNERLRQFYSKLWLGKGVNLSNLDIRTSRSLMFSGDAFHITELGIQRFVQSIQPQEQIRPRMPHESGSKLDLAIVIAWDAIMKAALSPAIDGDFLSLVHLSHEVTQLDDCSSLRPGDVACTTAEIVAILDNPTGRVARVRAIITTADVPIVRIESEFLFRNISTSPARCNGFDKTTEEPYYVDLHTPTKVAVLKAKNWIRWHSSKVPCLGQRIVFELQTVRHYNPDGSTVKVQTSGIIYGAGRQTLAEVYHEQDHDGTDTILDYLRRCGSLVTPTHHLETPRPLGLEHEQQQFTLPASSEKYSIASGDFNPIHLSTSFARYADLPGRITHGMFTCAQVRRLVENVAGHNPYVHMRQFRIKFLGMVLPNAKLKVEVTHVAMKGGVRVLSFKAWIVETDVQVASGTAEVDQLSTAYLFTGQGSQRVGMGMDLYATSKVARDVWDAADQFYSSTYGFLISQIVKCNPKELVIHFGGRRGRAVRQNYMDMKMQRNGQLVPVFDSIDQHTSKYTFRHSAGLLFSTEFSQPALTVLERAQYDHLYSKGLIDPNALFAGHSLGEYSALSTIGQVMSLDDLLSIAFYRALIMNTAVPRNAQGRSDFAMMALNPSRIAPGMETVALQEVVVRIASITGELLEVVNYNIERQQYVVSGSLTALACLSLVFDHLSNSGLDGSRSSETMLSNISELDALIAGCLVTVGEQTPPIVLKRGIATIPLEGIDVPFHSSHIMHEMPAFRRMLQHYIRPGSVDARRLVGKFISNVTGSTFGISPQHILEMFEITKSHVLRGILEEMKRSP